MKIKKEVSLLNHKVVFDYHKIDDLCMLTAFIKDDEYVCTYINDCKSTSDFIAHFYQKRQLMSLWGLHNFIVQTFIKNGWLNNLSQINEVYNVVNNVIDLPTDTKELDLIKLEQLFVQNIFWAWEKNTLIIRIMNKEEYFFNISDMKNIGKVYDLHELIVRKLVFKGKLFNLHDARLMHYVIAKFLKI